MLALPQRRQHLTPQHHTPSTLPSPPSPQHLPFDTIPHFSAQHLVDQKLLNDYLDSQQQDFAQPVVVDSAPNPFMTNAFDFINPAIRVQQSTPTPQLSSGYPQTSMLSSNATASGLPHWQNFNNVQGTNQSLQTPAQSHTGRTHQRASSSSSIGSNGSQYQPATSVAAGYPSFVNHNLPTPTHTPTQDSFMNPNIRNYNHNNNSGIESTMAAHFSMKQALMDQQVPEDDVPGFGHSARHSVSSYGHDSPATPHTAQGDDMDFKAAPNDMRQHPPPKLERTYTDVAADNFYDPNAQSPASAPSASASNASLLSPFRTNNSNDMMQRTLQAAEMARSSQSPQSAASRGNSPFRQNSPWRQSNPSFASSRMQMGNVAQAREQNVEADAAYAMKPQMQSSEESQPKTISPKEALLDHSEADEDSKGALFPEGGASEYDQYNGGDQYRGSTQSSFDATTSGPSYRRDSWATPQFPANLTTSSALPSSSAYTVPMNGVPYASSTSQYRSTPTTMAPAAEQVPDFPAHLTSMESSASEAEPGPGSQPSQHVLEKPSASHADTGTYTCTYHGCTQRFETPQKLQKHKREGHRNANPANTSAGMTSAALLDRNSQAGPHKCDRINPTTNKPCNAVFSRPYDLTRHEDTIHNARKQKVRCALCVEEKTFSRNDALTRHMRVVHPEVDFPGKHRRRGGNHD